MARQTLHRSENLMISWQDDTTRFDVELRFPTSSARGSCEGRCPRCGEVGRLAHWELEGPDGQANTAYLACPTDGSCAGMRDRGESYQWAQAVHFVEGWVERG
jgi:hypothetical protein